MTIFIKVILAVAALTLAAYLEVKGDKAIGIGVENKQLLSVLCGFGLLCLYGVAVNSYNAVLPFLRRRLDGQPWKFSDMLGVYIGFFALMNLYFAYRAPDATVSLSMKAGTFLIVAGGIVIQFGPWVARRLV